MECEMQTQIVDYGTPQEVKIVEAKQDDRRALLLDAMSVWAKNSIQLAIMVAAQT